MLWSAFKGGSFVWAGESGNTSRRPNIVLLIVDDLGWADLGCYGSSFHETPHIDALAAKGARLTQAYAAGSVCSPTRASFFTGRHPVRLDITDWIPGQNADREPGAIFEHIDDRDALALEEWTLAEALRDVGYQTYFVGKWHLGGEGHLPTDQGFDTNIGGYDIGSPPGGYYAPFKNPYLPDQPQDSYLTERLTEEAIHCLQERDPQRPFFLSFCYYNVHTPIEPYKKHVDKFRDKRTALFNSDSTPTQTEHSGTTRLRQDNPAYASMVAAVDDSVGKIQDFLEAADLDDNTIVILTSDNGGLSTLKNMGPTSNTPLRAGKGWLYEGGIRIPFIVSAPQQSATVVSHPISSCDLFPSLLQYANVSMPPDVQLDGESWLPLLHNSSPSVLPKERALFWHYPHYHGSMWTPGAAVRVGHWKLIDFFHWDKIELYNLDTDPSELNNLANDEPEQRDRLHKLLKNWQNIVQAKMPQRRAQ
jgi:arylsulfatase A-like enzyme